MRCSVGTLCVPLVFTLCAGHALAQSAPLTFDQVVERFHTNNPQLLAGQLNIAEAGANEITAGLKPNPVFSLTNDQYDFSTHPWANSQFTPTVSQLWERRQKRPLRIESAQLATAAAKTDQADLERNLIFNLRDAFNRVLLGNALLDLARENLRDYDKVISVNRDRLKNGDTSRMDFQRIELQRVQFVTDIENAQVNLRTAKIQLLALMNDRTPVDAFDVTGPFDFKEEIVLLDDLRKEALTSRPDLQSAKTNVVKAGIDNKLAWANGSADPILGFEYQKTPQVGPTTGFSVTLPIRIFDRNQGEKQRTALEIRRTQHLVTSAEAGIIRDVDSAYESLRSVVALLKEYRDKYLKESGDVRDLVSFSYSQGGASLLEFLDAQKSYRDTQVAFRNLIGTYESAVNQVNFAVGKEVLR